MRALFGFITVHLRVKDFWVLRFRLNHKTMVLNGFWKVLSVLFWGLAHGLTYA